MIFQCLKFIGVAFNIIFLNIKPLAINIFRETLYIRTNF